jgi:hypothetical protein
MAIMLESGAVPEWIPRRRRCNMFNLDYQITARKAGSRHIGAPSLMPKAS